MDNAQQEIVRTDDSKQLPSQFFKKSHDLIFSQTSLSPREHDLMALLLSRLHEEHWETFINGSLPKSPAYDFNSDVLCEWLGVKKADLFNTLSETAERLSERKIGIREDGKKSFTFIPLFKRLEYANATLTMTPNDELMIQYLGVSQGHAQVDHRVFRKLRREHSKRLYPLLCRFKNKGTKLHPQSISDLHGFFGLLNEKGELIKKSYVNNKVFIERCIKLPIEEISKVDSSIDFVIGSGGTVGYEPIKKGRKIDKIEFLFNWNSVFEKPVRSDEKDLSEELSYEDAVRSYWDIELERALPTPDEFNNVKKRLGELAMDDQIAINERFMTKFKGALAILGEGAV
ncbi:replication initiation protein [Photobacterium sp. BZF1]|nr:replication initiation protein [Photobacterium sp. BZF1]MBC7006399.1 replication initiation protein [Photobacterium sp. BZF1]